MNGFFKPMRRKIGAMTLVVACVFMAGWMRSFSQCDFVRFRTYGFGRSVYSIDGQLNCRWWVGMSRKFKFAFGKDKSRTVQEMDNERRSRSSLPGAEGLLGRISPSDVYRELAIPYWSLVIPLTLLSAWLLLSKPRAGKIGPAQSAN